MTPEAYISSILIMRSIDGSSTFEQTIGSCLQIFFKWLAAYPTSPQNGSHVFHHHCTVRLVQDHVQAICEHWEIYPCTTAEEAGKAYKDSGGYGPDHIQSKQSKSSKQIKKRKNNQSPSKAVKKTLHTFVYVKWLYSPSAGPYFHCQGFSRQWSRDCGQATAHQKTYAVPNYRSVP